MVGKAGEGSDGANGDGHELRRLAEGLAHEALSELEGLLAESVARLYRERHGALVAAALQALGDLA